MDSKQLNVVDYWVIYWLDSTKEVQSRIQNKFCSRLVIYLLHSVKVFIIWAAVSSSLILFTIRLAINMAKSLRISIDQSRIETGIGKMRIINTLKLGLRISQAMLDLTVWMLLQWPFIPFGLQILSRKWLSLMLIWEEIVIL